MELLQIISIIFYMLGGIGAYLSNRWNTLYWYLVGFIFGGLFGVAI